MSIVYEFIRNWTLFNIGEIVSIEGYSMDDDIRKCSRILLAQTGASEYIRTNEQNGEFEYDTTIFVTHLNLDEVNQ